MKVKLCIAALTLAIGGSSVAQTPPAPDPLLCSGMESILQKAGPNGWERGTDPTIPFDGGEAKCVSIPGFKRMSCTMTKVESCTGKLATPEESTKAMSIIAYSQTRGAMTMDSCLRGYTFSPYTRQSDVGGVQYAAQGGDYRLAGKPRVTFFQTQTVKIEADKQCMSRGFMLDFEVE